MKKHQKPPAPIEITYLDTLTNMMATRLETPEEAKNRVNQTRKELSAAYKRREKRVALEKAWKFISTGATGPLHFDIKLSKDRIKRRKDCLTMTWVVHSDSPFEPGVPGSITWSLRRRSAKIPPHFVHEVVVK